ncbi:hypothetical protein ABBQ38_006132 [Trebouxia sp. C0009 RCD-2024]
MFRRALQQERFVRHLAPSSICRRFAGSSAGVGNSTKAPSAGAAQRGETAASQHDADYMSNLKEAQGKEGGKSVGGGQMSPSSAAAQGGAGDDRGGKTDKSGKASGKVSNQDETNTETVGGTQTKKGQVGAGATSTIGRG